MNRLKNHHLLGALLFAASIAVTPNAGASPTTPHEIMQHLAAERLATSSTHWILPQNWRLTATQDPLEFLVPYHPGVYGSIKKIQNNNALEETLAEIEQTFHTQLTIDKTSDPSIPNDYTIASGRFAGEIWRVFIRIDQTQSQPYRIYAITPDRWFQTYLPFFSQIQYAQTTP